MVQFTDRSSRPKTDEVEEVPKLSISTTSDDDAPAGHLKRKSEGEHSSKKKKRKSKLERGKINGVSHGKRRLSVSKPPRDPRDEVFPPTPLPELETRSPSPVIDFDGLSRPSRFPSLQLWSLANAEQALARGNERRSLPSRPSSD